MRVVRELDMLIAIASEYGSFIERPFKQDDIIFFSKKELTSNLLRDIASAESGKIHPVTMYAYEIISR